MVEGSVTLKNSSVIFEGKCGTVLEFASKLKLTQMAFEIMKPIACSLCEERFPDQPSCDQHEKFTHGKGQQSSRHIDAKAALSVPEPKQELKKRGLNTVGNKEVLLKRLEGSLTGEM